VCFALLLPLPESFFVGFTVTSACRVVIYVAANGEAYTWGCCRGGRLGIPVSSDVYIPHLVAPLTEHGEVVRQISCGARHTAAVTSTGSLWLWGMMSLGDGIGGRQSWPSPVCVPVHAVTSSDAEQSGGDAPAPVSAVCCGSGFTLAMLRDGRAVAWGIARAACASETAPLRIAPEARVYGLPTSTSTPGAGRGRRGSYGDARDTGVAVVSTRQAELAAPRGTSRRKSFLEYQEALSGLLSGVGGDVSMPTALGAALLDDGPSNGGQAHIPVATIQLNGIDGFADSQSSAAPRRGSSKGSAEFTSVPGGSWADGGVSVQGGMAVAGGGSSARLGAGAEVQYSGHSEREYVPAVPVSPYSEDGGYPAGDVGVDVAAEGVLADAVRARSARVMQGESALDDDDMLAAMVDTWGELLPSEGVDGLVPAPTVPDEDKLVGLHIKNALSM
jgi:hypothetical protein